MRADRQVEGFDAAIDHVEDPIAEERGGLHDRSVAENRHAAPEVEIAEVAQVVLPRQREPVRRPRGEHDGVRRALAGLATGSIDDHVPARLQHRLA